jgi:hypothetical protein
MKKTSLILTALAFAAGAQAAVIPPGVQLKPTQTLVSKKRSDPL